MINNMVSQFGRMLADLTKSSSSNSLQGNLGFLDTQDEKRDGSSIINSIGEVCGVLRNETQSPGSSFFDRRVEFFETDDQSIEGT